MVQLRSTPFRSEASSHHRACAAYDEAFRGVKFAPARMTYYRQQRAPSQQPNHLARVMAHISEGRRAGATEAQARVFVQALVEHIDREYGPERVWERDMVLTAHRFENEQNIAETELLMGHDRPEQLRAYAKATRRAAIAGLIAADAADMEAARLTFGGY